MAHATRAFSFFRAATCLLREEPLPQLTLHAPSRPASAPVRSLHRERALPRHELVGPDDAPVVVALGDAWNTGAASWTTQARVNFANDPDNLLAVDGPTNESKGDQDAASWQPPNLAYRCKYATRQVQVKTKYHLTVTPEEQHALRALLRSCPA